MHAAVITAPERVEVDRNYPRPCPDRGQVLLAVRATGICGTDLTILSGHHPRARWPLIPGHEMLCVVDALGAEVPDNGLRPGQRVVVNPLLTCGVCQACMRGRSHVCEELRLLGIDAPGGLAEYVVADARRLVPLPETVQDPVGALAEPLAVAVRAMRQAAFVAGEAVAVLGAGPIGLLVALVARQAHAARVFLVDVRPGRVEFARRLGLTAERVDEIVPSAELSGAFDVVFDCTGDHRAIDRALALVATAGRIVIAGVPHDPSTVHLRTLNFRELRLIGTRVYADDDMRQAIEMLPVLQPWLARLVTHQVPLEQTSRAFELVRTEPDAIKVLVTVS